MLVGNESHSNGALAGHGNGQALRPLPTRVVSSSNRKWSVGRHLAFGQAAMNLRLFTQRLLAVCVFALLPLSAHAGTASRGPRKAAKINAKPLGQRPAMHLVISRIPRSARFDVKGKKGNALLSKLVEQAHWVSEISLRRSKGDEHRAILQSRSLERMVEGGTFDVSSSTDLLSFGGKAGFEQAVAIAGPQPSLQNIYGKTLGAELVKRRLSLKAPIKALVSLSGGVYVGARWAYGNGLPYLELRTPHPTSEVDDVFLTMSSKGFGSPVAFFTDGEKKVNFGMDDVPGITFDAGLLPKEKADGVHPDGRLIRIDAYVSDESLIE